MYNPEPVLTAYQKYLQAEQLAWRSRKVYSSLLKAFLETHRCQPQRISKQMIIAYLAGIVSPVTRKQVRAAIDKLYTMLGHSDKMEGVPYPKQPKSLPKILTKGEVQRLMECTTNLKHRTILMLLYQGALRISELQNLKVSQVNGEEALLKIVNSKGAKDRNVPLKHELIPELRKYFMRYRPKHYLIEGATGGIYSQQSIRNILKDSLKKAGITTQIKAHGLRHSRATHLYSAGVKLLDLKNFLGHTKTETTEIYIHLSATDVATAIREAS